MTRVLIAGAGIGGAAAALALHKAGFDVEVYEAHPTAGADIGAFLTLASNGMLALGQFDAAQPVAEVGFALTRMRVLTEDGTLLAKAPMGMVDNPLTQYRCLRRAQLGAVLHDEVLRRGIPVNHGAQLVAATEDADAVTATFADGRTAQGDLLIGADGLNSALRTIIDPDTAPPRYAGQRVFYGYTTDIEPRCEPEEIILIPGSTAAFGLMASPVGETYWFARVPDAAPLPAEEIAARSAGVWRDLLVPLLRADNTPAEDVVAATSDDLLVTNARDLAAVANWHTSRMLVIGDAAHAASPATGQGAAMAVEDAVILAKALRDSANSANLDSADLQTAFATYERIRRPRVERNIANSARMTVDRMPDRRQRAEDNERIQRQREQQADSNETDELLRQLDWHTPLTPAAE